MMSYTLATLWHGRQRFLPAVLAVAFSALLVALQCGLILGALSIVSLPVDNTSAHIWIGAPKLVSVDVAQPIPASWRVRCNMPEVEHCELFIRGCPLWHKPTGGSDLCVVIGSRLHEGAVGCMRQLTPELRARLSEPGSVVVDEEDLGRLGLRGIGQTAEIAGQRVRIVGLVRGLKGIAGPHVLCSIETAQRLVRLSPEQATFLLVRCRQAEDVPHVLQQLGKYPGMTVLAAESLSRRSQTHWLFKTGAGVALGLAGLLGLLVGAVITSQTLYAATVSALREYAVLRAMGIPRWRLAACVLNQSLWIGLAGIALALPIIFVLTQLGIALGANMILPPWLLGSTMGVTMAVALLSGLTALRSLRLIEPAVLLR